MSVTRYGAYKAKYNRERIQYRKGCEKMCNLSQGIREEAFKEGQKYGYEKIVKKLVLGMQKAGVPLEQIAKIAEMSVEDVKEIIG